MTRQFKQLEQKQAINEITTEVYNVSQILISETGHEGAGWVETIAFPTDENKPQIRFPDDRDIEHVVKFIEVSSRKTLTDKSKIVGGEIQVWALQWNTFIDSHDIQENQ